VFADEHYCRYPPRKDGQAELVRPIRKRRLTLVLEHVIDWFRSQEQHYRSRINTILRG
jgi:uncharacterized protein (DUF4415 family)